MTATAHHTNVSELRDALSMVVKMLANKGIKVTQSGIQAYVQYDKKTLEPTRVNIPSISNTSSPELVTAIKGFVDHEVGHLLFTDARIVNRAVEERIANLHNIVEDTFIERRMKETFAGSTRNIDRTVEFAVKHFFQRTFDKNIADFRAAQGSVSQARFFVHVLAVPGIRALAGHEAAIDFMQDKWELIPDVYDALLPLQHDLETIKNSLQALKLANSIRDILANCEREEEEKREQAANPPTPEEDDGDDDGLSGSSGGSESESKSDSAPSSGDQIFDDNKEPSNSKALSPNKPQPKSEDEEAPEQPSEGDDREEPESSDDNHMGEDGSDSSAKEPGEQEDEPGDEEEGTGDAESEGDEEEDAEGDSEGSGDTDEEGDESDADNGDTEADGDDAEGDSDGDADADGEGEGDDSAAGDEEGDEDDLTDDGSTGNERNRDTTSGDIGESRTSDGDQRDHAPLNDDIEKMETFDHALEQVISEGAKDSLATRGYMPFSTEDDEIEKHVIPANRMSNAKSRLSDIRSSNQERIGVMAKSLERLVAARNRSMFVPGFRSGRLHSSGLYKLQTGDTRVFRRKEEIKTKNTAVLLLVDCSGSMNHRSRIVTASEAAYALCSSLERIKVKTQVVGFTTKQEWGQLYEAQDQLEKLTEQDPSFQGGFDRAVPLLMPIFKTFDERMTPDSETRLASIPFVPLGNNCDSESVEIAANMLAARQEERKILIVLSDGQPASPRVYAGSEDYDRPMVHLKQVVADATKRGIETLGIGIESDSVEQYYPKHIVLENVGELPSKIMTEMSRLLLN